MKRQWQSIYVPFIRSERGSVAVIIALALFVLILGAGIAVDMARAQILQSKIQSSLDTSGLAAVGTIAYKPENVAELEWVQTQAQRYFRTNFPTGYLETNAITVNASLDADGNTFTFNAFTPQSTTFLQAAGIMSVNVEAVSKVTRASAGQGMELVLVLDTTGSMNCDVSITNPKPPCALTPNSKIVALKSAANSLLDILYGPKSDTASGLFVGVVPFSQVVNIGPSRTGWLNPGANGKDAVNAGPGAYPGDWGPGGSWAGCVLARESPYDTNDFNPGATHGGFDVYWYPPEPAGDADQANFLRIYFGTYSNYNPYPASTTPAVYPIRGWRSDISSPTYLPGLSTTTYGPNLNCPQPMTAMVSSKSTVKLAIDNMIAQGDTLINEGIVWGWRMLSPNWRNWWGGEMDANNLPLDYDPNATRSRKVVVLMSDGWNSFSNYNYTAYEFLVYFAGRYTNIDMYMKGLAGEYTYTRSVIEDMMDKKTLAVCDALKARSVTVYTVGFGKIGPKSDQSSVNTDLLKSCASDEEHYFYAPSDEALKAAFKKIGKSLVNLRVSK